MVSFFAEDKFFRFWPETMHGFGFGSPKKDLREMYHVKEHLKSY